MAGAHRIKKSMRMVLAGTLPLLAVLILSGTPSHADDSGCVVCHTDIDLLEENLGEQTKKKSALQSGAG